MQHETTESPGSTDEGAPVTTDDGASRAPVHATDLAEEAKDEIRQAAERRPEQQGSQSGKTATSTPTKYEADAITASRTPTHAAERALEEALEAEARESGGGEDMSEYPTAKEVAERVLQDGATDELDG